MSRPETEKSRPRPRADWQPSTLQRERDRYRRARTVRSGVIAAVSTLVVIGGAAWLVA